MTGRRRLFVLILVGESEVVNDWVQDAKDFGLIDVVRFRKAGSHSYLRIVEEDAEQRLEPKGALEAKAE